MEYMILSISIYDRYFSFPHTCVTNLKKFHYVYLDENIPFQPATVRARADLLRRALVALAGSGKPLTARDDGAPMPINSKHSLEEQLGLKKTMGQSYARMLQEVLAASAFRPRTPLSKASSTLASPMSEFRSVLSFFLVRSHVFII